MLPKLNRQLFILWLIILLLVWFSAIWDSKRAGGKRFQSNMLPSTQCWNQLGNHTGRMENIWSLAVCKGDNSPVSSFLNHMGWMQKALERSMVEKTGNKKTAGWYEVSRCDKQTHRYLLQLERPALSHYEWNRHVHNYGQVIKWYSRTIRNKSGLS